MKIPSYVWVIVVVLFLGGFIYWGISSAPKIPEADIVTKQGLHWHIHLSIKINGQEIEIPSNIGVNGIMGANGEPMELHTHDASGIIHAEFAGLVTKEQLHLGNFFKVWGKDFSKDFILGNKIDATHNITMTVNGVPNTDFENYQINKEGAYDAGDLGKIDDIQIIYQ